LDHNQDALAEGFRLLVNEAMKAERDYALNAAPYERTDERLNQELKRRTRVAMIFPSETALERLVTALLMEQSEQWETDKTYLTMEN
jgi:transposase-like protein